MSRQLQPPVPLVSLVKTEPPTVIKNEPPEEALKKEISPDIKDVDIIYHSLSEDLIKSETVPENILETKYLKSEETQVLVKTENISHKNITIGTGQDLIEVLGSHEHSNTLNNLEAYRQFVLNSSKDLNGISASSRKEKHAKKTDFARCSKTDGTSSDKEKIKVIRASVVPLEPHEYTSLAKDKHVCNHCQNACNNLNYLKIHINKMHRETTTMYQCPYCTYKSKWRSALPLHIISNHKDTKDIQWAQCNLCEMKFKLKGHLARHMKVHLSQKQVKDGLDLSEKRHHCNKCNYKTYTSTGLKRHKLVHLKPEKIQYFYCYHCSQKSKVKADLKKHIFRQHFKNVTLGKRYGCNKCDYETYTSTQLKYHNLTHVKPEEIQYFYCYHCSYKTNRKDHLKKHIFRHFKKEQIEFDCYICNFMTSKRKSIIKHIKKHSNDQNKFKIDEGS